MAVLPAGVRRRGVLPWLVAGLLMLLPCAAAAATWYVRTDGGTAAQCTGAADAPYPGKGEGVACAWSHPFIALPPQTPEHPVPARIAGGDTLVIGAGSYAMGYGAPAAEACYESFTPDCHMQAVPAGPDKAHPTRVLGAGWDQGCKAPPELWGTGAAHRILDLTKSSNSEVACLELTDHSSCIVNHCSMDNCTGGPAERDRCGEGDDKAYAQNGLWSTDAANVVLRDLDIHGIGGEAVHAGRMADWTVERVRLWANGFAGWDADVSNGGVEPTASTGTLSFRHVEIAWNGCGERWPGGEIFGCWGQLEGGYGDGLATGRSGGRWLVEDSHVHHNTQDGIDLLYVDGGKVELRRVRAEGNAGNQVKGSGEVLVEDADLDGNCAAMRGKGNLQPGDLCRADGAAVAIALVDGTRSEVRGSRITGEGGCLVTGSSGGTGSLLALHDNTLTGKPRWDDPKRLTCGYFLYESQGRIEASGNTIDNVSTSSTMTQFCARQIQGSLMDEACHKIRDAYRALQDRKKGG